MKQKTKFKQTEIGKIPEDWGMENLNEIANITMGQSPPSKTYNYDKKGLPFFQGRKDFGGKYPSVTVWCSEPKRTANKGDILISVRAPIGDINIATAKCCIGRGLAALSMKNRNNEFLYHLMRYSKNRLKSVFEGEGTVFGCLTKEGLNNFEFTIPVNINEQKAIAKILSDLDSKIELNNQMNKTLESISQVLFKHWFVDFEFPNEEGKPYKSSGGERVGSELGEIPKGWETVNLSNIVDYTFGYPFNSKLFNEKGDGFPIIRIRDLPNNDSKVYTTENFEEQYIVTAGDIVVGMDGEFRAYLWGGRQVLLNQRIVKISPKYDYIPKAYVYFVIAKPLRFIENSKTGTTVIHLNKTDLDAIKVLLPDKNILKTYGITAKNLINLQVKNNMESINLAKTRDTILPKLMSGQVRVPVEVRT